MEIYQESLEYHRRKPFGKIEVVSTKPVQTQHDLALAYSPGVAEPCREIHKAPARVFDYTARGNLVAVITNGTAVLGLGNIGPLAAKPVMEGKAVLFKRFAGVDVFDLELNTRDPEEIIRTCQLLEPTFGGINLEDIGAPDCFYIEERLRATLNIPVLHDDQHGTAIISGAALVNALHLNGKDIKDVRVVFSGAGASGLACARMYENLGVRREHIIVCDSQGTIRKDRDDLQPDHPKYNKYKAYFASDTTCRTLEEALAGADVFCGCSVANTVSQKMIQSMGRDPVVFAMANPDPEISYPDAIASRPDAIVATGRSDYPNQVNNVLGFPFIFRGALDTHATEINEAMKLAAVNALAMLAREDVLDYVAAGYGLSHLKFGREYLIPKPIDHRVLLRVSVAVAKAAVESGAARIQMTDFEAYRDHLEKILGPERELTRGLITRARSAPQRIAFPEGDNRSIIRAADMILDEGIGTPVLIGNRKRIEAVQSELSLKLKGCEILDPDELPAEQLEGYVEELWQRRLHRGVTKWDARRLLKNSNYLAALMLRRNEVKAMIGGVTQYYPDTIRPALQILDRKPGVSRVGALCAVLFKNHSLFLADTSVNIDYKSAADLAEIAILSADTVRDVFLVEPRVAIVSYSNYGSVWNEQTIKAAEAVEQARRLRPDLAIDGEIQIQTALNQAILREDFPFSPLLGSNVNTLVFPDLLSANTAYQLLESSGGAEVIGPILMGMSESVHVLQRRSSVSEIVRMAALAVVDSQ